jgi:hypothetical protein
MNFFKGTEINVNVWKIVREQKGIYPVILESYFLIFKII